MDSLPFMKLFQKVTPCIWAQILLFGLIFLLTLPVWGATARLEQGAQGEMTLFLPLEALSKDPKLCQVLEGWPEYGLSLQCPSALWQQIAPPVLDKTLPATLQWRDNGVLLLLTAHDPTPQWALTPQGLRLQWRSSPAAEADSPAVTHMEVQWDEQAWHLFIQGDAPLPEPRVQWLPATATLVLDWPQLSHRLPPLPGADAWVRGLQLSHHEGGLRLTVGLRDAKQHWRLEQRDGRYQVTLSHSRYHSARMKDHALATPLPSYQFVAASLAEAAHLLAQQAQLSLVGLEGLQGIVENQTFTSTAAAQALVQLLDAYGWSLQPLEGEDRLQIVRRP
ncbi:hypothetical protein Mmc1_2320 [Magnetococcus marinus MC-1]|uniref:Uncharacterized protein n=2 Tax=Magnetococcus TaxID=162171 RepID=A0LA27_MAGMM|nr:hypothetical protein Mmc1_2320 [Magnetococcus marinus MC-1]